MYSLNSYNFGNLFRTARKAKRLSIEEIAKKIDKAPSTVYKYEKNTIIPDFETVINICNALEIKLDELAFREEVDTNIETTNNPFSTDTLYMYYIDNTDKLYEMKLEIKAEDGIMKVYFKVPSLNDKIFFVGSIESNSDVAFIMLKNYGSSNKHFEKVMIFINMNHSSDNKKMGIICGEKDNTYVPVVKKVCIAKQPLNESEKENIINRLKISKVETEQMIKDGYWYPDISNEVGY